MKRYTKLYIITTVIFLVLFYILDFFFLKYFPDKYFLYGILNVFLFVGIFIYAYKTFLDNKKWFRSLFTSNKKIFFQGLIGVLIVTIFTISQTYLLLKFNPQVARPILISSYDFYKNNSWNLIFLCLTAPILEELIFRGIFCQNHDSSKTAIIVSSVLFYIGHIKIFPSFSIPSLNILLLGFLFGYLFVKTKSLIPSIMAHISFNTLHWLLTPWILSLI